jgi:hypothetical protein
MCLLEKDLQEYRTDSDESFCLVCVHSCRQTPPPPSMTNSHLSPWAIYLTLIEQMVRVTKKLPKTLIFSKSIQWKPHMETVLVVQVYRALEETNIFIIQNQTPIGHHKVNVIQ